MSLSSQTTSPPTRSTFKIVRLMLEEMSQEERILALEKYYDIIISSKPVLEMNNPDFLALQKLLKSLIPEVIE